MRSRRTPATKPKKNKTGGLKKGVVRRATKKGLRVRRRSVKRMRRGGDLEEALAHVLTFFIVGCGESTAMVMYLNTLSPRILEVIQVIVGFGGDVMKATVQFSAACSAYALRIGAAAGAAAGASASLWVFTVALTVDSTVLLWRGQGLVDTWERRWGRCADALRNAGRNIGRYLIFGAIATGRIFTSVYERINANRDIRALCCTQAIIYGNIHAAVLVSMRTLDTINHEGQQERIGPVFAAVADQLPHINPAVPVADVAGVLADPRVAALAAGLPAPLPPPPEEEEACDLPAIGSGGGLQGGDPINPLVEREFINTTIYEVFTNEKRSQEAQDGEGDEVVATAKRPRS